MWQVTHVTCHMSRVTWFIFLPSPPKKISVLWSASVERFSVSRMRDFFPSMFYYLCVCLSSPSCPCPDPCPCLYTCTFTSSLFLHTLLPCTFTHSLPLPTSSSSCPLPFPLLPPAHLWRSMKTVLSRLNCVRPASLPAVITSHSENLVRNPVQAALQQPTSNTLVVQVVKCVLYKVWSVYCTSVSCVLYKVCRLYCTRCTVCIIQGVQCEFYIKI